MKCSECLHHSKGPRRFERLCSQLGVEPFAPACPEFTPDMTVLASVSMDGMRALAQMANSLTQAQTRLLAFTFRNIDYIKKTGFQFGQTLVFSIDGKDYLENFFRGIAIGATRDGSVVYMASSLDGLNGEQCFLSLMKREVYTLDEFKKHRQKLIDKGLIRAPLPSKFSSRKTILQMLRMSPEEVSILKRQIKNKPETYDPPSIDTVPNKWLDARQSGTLKKRKAPEKFKVKRPADLVDEVASGPFSVNRYI